MKQIRVTLAAEPKATRLVRDLPRGTVYCDTDRDLCLRTRKGFITLGAFSAYDMGPDSMFDNIEHTEVYGVLDVQVGPPDRVVADLADLDDEDADEE